MERAIALSRRGYPAPNPHVGCVLVRNGEVIGEGFHMFAGSPHAEAVALLRAGSQAIGATAYVTLEPCNHAGRTPPCSLALIAAGIKRVVYSCPDPNAVASGGVKALRDHSIEVEHFVSHEHRARAANEVFLSAHERGRAFITLKAAIGMDGRISLPNGESRWITGEAARRAGHKLRAEMGAVLVGAGTLLHDDPVLTARVPGVRNQPLPLVLMDRPLTPRIFRAENLKAVFWHGGAWVISSIAEAAPEEGGDIGLLPASLFAFGCTGLLVEGGAKTHSKFLTAGIVDRVDLFMAPRILGGGPSWCELDGLDALAPAPRWVLDRTHRLGQDVHLSFRPR